MRTMITLTETSRNVTVYCSVSIQRDPFGTGDSPDEAELDIFSVSINGELATEEDLTPTEYDELSAKAWKEWGRGQ